MLSRDEVLSFRKYCEHKESEGLKVKLQYDLVLTALELMTDNAALRERAEKAEAEVERLKGVPLTATCVQVMNDATGFAEAFDNLRLENVVLQRKFSLLMDVARAAKKCFDQTGEVIWEGNAERMLKRTLAAARNGGCEI